MFGYLFYSPRCESSANFIRIITSEKINQMFNLISIDTMSTEQILSLGIKKTPMLVLRDNNNKTIGVNEGQSAFEWLNNLIQFRRQNMAKIVEENRKKLLQANMAQNMNKDLVSGKSDELTGIRFPSNISTTFSKSTNCIFIESTKSVIFMASLQVSFKNICRLNVLL